MTKPLQIVLPTGTRTVALSDIPTKLAHAIHPTLSDAPLVLKSLDKTILGPNGTYARPKPLSDDDLALLADVLGHVPHVGQTFASEGEWQAYVKPLADSPRKPDWTLIPLFENKALNADILRLAAEDEHKAALIAQIRADKLVPLNHALLPVDRSVSEVLSLGQVSVDTFRDYAAKFGVSVRTEPPGTIIKDLVDRIAKETAARHPEKWQDPNDPDPIRRTIVAAMNVHGWPLDGIPGVLPFVIDEIKSGHIEAFSLFNDLPCRDGQLIQANPAQWYVTQEGEQHIVRAIGEAVIRSQERVRERSEQNAAQQAANALAKSEAGRYTIKEACAVLFKATGIYADRWKKTMLESIQKGDLPLRNPTDYSDRLPYAVPKQLLSFYEQVDADGLNGWLDAHKEWNVIYRFPAPPPQITTPADSTVELKAEPDAEYAAKPQGWRKRDILSEIRNLGLDPLKLPPIPKDTTKTWVKSKVWSALNWNPAERKSFDNAWLALRRERRICELQTQPPPS